MFYQFISLFSIADDIIQVISLSFPVVGELQTLLNNLKVSVPYYCAGNIL